VIRRASGITVRRRSQAFFDSIGQQRRLCDVRIMADLPAITGHSLARRHGSEGPMGEDALIDHLVGKHYNAFAFAFAYSSTNLLSAECVLNKRS
jgi:hypothetical protein